MIRDTRVCTVAGVLAAGMDCGHTRSDETESMTLDQAIEFLEPQIGTKDKPERAGAMCLSADDYVQNKNDLEILCRLMGSRCTYEAQQAIQDAGRRLDALKKKGLDKRVKLKKSVKK